MMNRPLEEIQTSIAAGESCVVNLTALWCSDCTDQSQNLGAFSDALATKQIATYSVTIQEEKNVYLSEDHQAFTESVGGHGFPRTVLVIKGKVVDADNVEVITSEQLNDLAQKFLQQL